MKFTLLGPTLRFPTPQPTPHKVWHSTVATFQHTPPPPRPCAQVWHPASLSCRRLTLCKQPSSLWSWLGCNSKRSCAINVSWQEKLWIACCSSSCLTSLPSLLPLSSPVIRARKERKRKAVLKPYLSASLFVHCAEGYSEKLH